MSSRRSDRRRSTDRPHDSRLNVCATAAQKLIALALISATGLGLAYFILAAIVVIRTGDAASVAEIGRSAAELVRAFIGITRS
jgi:uncharacterized membrane protein